MTGTRPGPASATNVSASVSSLYTLYGVDIRRAARRHFPPFAFRASADHYSWYWSRAFSGITTAYLGGNLATFAPYIHPSRPYARTPRSDTPKRAHRAPASTLKIQPPFSKKAVSLTQLLSLIPIPSSPHLWHVGATAFMQRRNWRRSRGRGDRRAYFQSVASAHPASCRRSSCQRLALALAHVRGACRLIGRRLCLAQRGGALSAVRLLLCGGERDGEAELGVLRVTLALVLLE